MYDGLDADTKLVNDRWTYKDGGTNTIDIDEVIYWWDSNDCAERLRQSAMTTSRPTTPPATRGMRLKRRGNAMRPTLVRLDKPEGVLELVERSSAAKPLLPPFAAWWNRLGTRPN